MQTTSPITTPLDAQAIKTEFPILNQPPSPGRPPLVFLDTAASSQKPAVVIEALDRYYRESNANIHRGVYELSERATAAYEETRKKIARFINANRAREIVFTRNTTEAINLVARSWGGANLREGDLVVITEMEHHSNIVPWQLITEEKGARIAWVPVTPEGRLDLDAFDALLAQGPKLVAVTHVSNSLGTINPVAEIARRAHEAGALVLVDAAQSAPHARLDVQALDVDFLAFSGHKMLGPMGIGVLYGKLHLLEAMPPYMGGGSMIRKVTTAGSTWADVPAKFEAGTPAVGDAVAFGTAIDYLEGIGMDAVLAHEQALVAYAFERLADVPDVTVLGPGPDSERAGVISFTLGEIHPHDVAAILDEQNVAVRAGHHCCQPLLHALGTHTTTRASFYIYTTRDDIDRLADGLRHARQIFGMA